MEFSMGIPLLFSQTKILLFLEGSKTLKREQKSGLPSIFQND